jgi:hypothetical protein
VEEYSHNLKKSMNDSCKVRCYCNFTFSKKKLEELLSYRPSCSNCLVCLRSNMVKVHWVTTAISSYFHVIFLLRMESIFYLMQSTRPS